MANSDTLVIGLDIGGTSSRALVSTLTGIPVGYGRAGAGNPVSRPPEAAAAAMLSALRQALAGLDAAEVRAGVLGLAGRGRLADARVGAIFQRAWEDAGLRCPMRVVGDVLVAFASGSGDPAGTVLVSGTGAVAAEIRDGRVHRTADGLGWLLGDEGSAFWLGREAVRRVTRDIYADRQTGPLATLVTRHLLGPDGLTGDRGEDADAVVTASYALVPRALARLAPLVSQAAAEDPLARDIVQDAAARLAGSVAEIRDAASENPIVLSGGVLTSGGPVTAAVRRLLRDRWKAPVFTAAPGVVGGVCLAARALARVDVDELRARLQEAAPWRPPADSPDTHGKDRHADPPTGHVRPGER
ncbi:BadF/BadG/BcrA/BcrD ATPase family protein [Microtetraspora sp. NBRC 16547]|uniref:N-acetylglucosamine kinase n=1 Tax=Microtetraspora sp. NBRC 16547 TaxID=3030993 RepID=UPI0024A44E8E|nr:BadF/BadG/BcrA/BcrD ATPase family protein [Microtetraspora sp. NBRC 16547]GLX02327.1 N-acetylglucosamine kinase [Microtetraspora sp. NBRC 16547]